MDPAMKDLILTAGSMLALVGAVLGALFWLIYHVGKEHFISKTQMKELRESIHSTLGRMETNWDRDRDVMLKEIGSLDKDVRDAVSVAYKAQSEAREARHEVDIIKAKVDPLRQVPDRLMRIETLLFERFKKEDG